MKSLAGLRVLLGPSSFAEVDLAPQRLLLEAGLTLVSNPYRRRLNREELVKLLDTEIVGIIAGLEPLDRMTLERSQLRVISRCGSGLSNVDLRAAADFGIVVRSTPDGPTNAVAEITVGALLSLARSIHTMNDAMHEGKWPKTIGTQLEGKTVVIVGFGRIGRRVAQCLAPFQPKIVVADPLVDPQSAGVAVLPLSEALQLADVVSFHCSGEEEVLGEKEFALLKPGVLLLNGARGGVINESALQNALDRGLVAGAWLDCFAEEPYQGPLRGYSQVLLTPHVGSYTAECRLRMESEAAKNLLEAFREL